MKIIKKVSDIMPIHDLYGRFVSHLKDIAQQNEIYLSEEDLNEILTVIITIRKIDKTIDAMDTNKKQKFIDGLIALLEGKETDYYFQEANDAVIYCNKLIQQKQIGESFKKTLLKCLLSGNTLSQTTNTKSYITSRYREGLLSGQFFDDFLSIKYHNKKYLRFIETIKRLAGLTNLLDSVVDINDDYKTNRITIKPTVKLYTQLISSIFILGRKIHRDNLSTKQIVSATAKMIKALLYTKEANGS